MKVLFFGGTIISLSRIYLDNAATSWPKPPSVYQAVEHYLRENGAPAGRSAYHEAGQSQRLVQNARNATAKLLNVADPHRIIFTLNGTDSLNVALHGLLRNGDHVITSVVEHNSVLRPLRYLEEHRKIEVTRVGCSACGVVDAEDIRRAVRPHTRLIALLHASNVTGAIQPVEAVGQIAYDHGLLYLIDAAQSAGHLNVHPQSLGAHLVAAPGHKGLLGPLGVGLLYVAPGIEQQLHCVRQGGTGSQSEEDRQPEHLPDKYECGNHNVPALAGLAAGIEYLQQQGLNDLRLHEQELTQSLVRGLADIEGVTVYGSAEQLTADQRIGVVGFQVRGFDAQEVASVLDSAYSIQVRAGLHCAPLVHKALGTARSARVSDPDAGKPSGTIRFSLGPFTTPEHIDAAVNAVREISQAATR